LSTESAWLAGGGAPGQSRIGQGAERRTSEDIRVESAVLAYIVAERPQGVIIPALALRFAAEFDQGSSGLAVERAVRELVRDGRLRMQGGKVVPMLRLWVVR
jgi:hypothetical protein